MIAKTLKKHIEQARAEWDAREAKRKVKGSIPFEDEALVYAVQDYLSSKGSLNKTDRKYLAKTYPELLRLDDEERWNEEHTHIFKITHIDWDIEDEGRDDNGLPITAKDLGLPAWDEEITATIVLDDDKDPDEAITDWLSDTYGYCVNGASYYDETEDGADFVDPVGNDGEGRVARHDLK